jgi:UDP-N-acetylmuramoyl-L-alanyl-D-glutamate--2,6-diaminopimelate ligase
LSELCAPFPALAVERGGDRGIGGVSEDSRSAGPETLFVAVRGTAVDGHDYVEQALERGCRALLVERERSAAARRAAAATAAALATANSTRGYPSLLSRELAGRPDAGIVVVGVTGTNGKTTTAFLLQRLLGAAAGRCGLVGTIRYDDGVDQRPAPLTTPSGSTLFPWLRSFVAGGGRALALEISSHALDQDRVAGLALDAAVLTNLGRDHLDYHGDLGSYLAAKLRIFELLRSASVRGAKPAGAAVVNAADPALAELAPEGLPTVRYDPVGTCAGSVDVRLDDVEITRAGMRLAVIAGDRRATFETRLVGRFNVHNLVAAFATGCALGFAPETCAAALEGAEPVPGRLEQIELPSGGLAVIDYAHTPDALAAALDVCRELAGGQVLLVFGCGGDRDRGKRPQMGAVAAARADRVWITTDNPRTEDPGAICAEIAAGAAGVMGAVAPCVILERRDAIRTALASAQSGEVVLIAGKGHEDYQIVGRQRRHLDDREIVRDWIAGEGRRA